MDIAATIAAQGFAVVPGVYTADEISAIENAIATADTEKISLRQADTVFAIRNFFQQVPGVLPHIFTASMLDTLQCLLGNDYFISKAIYFDKPAAANWVVPWHRDMTINLTHKIETPGYRYWLQKENYYSVQPPVSVLQNTVTLRIHLDDTNENNGALKVVPGSHLQNIDNNNSGKNAVLCTVPKGGIMLMKPLLLHASAKSMVQQSRRVIHVELTNQYLSNGLQWAEAQSLSHRTDFGSISV